MSALKEKTLIEKFAQKIDSFHEAVESSLEASYENQKDQFEKGEYNYLISEGSIEYDRVELCEDLQNIVDSKIATKEEIVDLAIEHSWINPSYDVQSSPFQYGGAQENEVYCYNVPEISNQEDYETYKEYAPTDKESNLDISEVKDWCSNNEYFDKYFDLMNNKNSFYTSYSADYDVVRYVMDEEALLDHYKDEIEEAAKQSKVLFHHYDQMEQAFVGTSKLKIDLNVMCNSYRDVKCFDCGEPWDVGEILSDLNEENPEQKEVILTQPSDDPHGDLFIQIHGVRKCPCC